MTSLVFPEATREEIAAYLHTLAEAISRGDAKPIAVREYTKSEYVDTSYQSSYKAESVQKYTLQKTKKPITGAIIEWRAAK